jgi:outer membrane protein assembly factor BamD
MVRSYDKLDLVVLRDDSMRVLKQTFPESRFVTGKLDRPWWQFWSEGKYVTTSPSDKPWWQFW